MSLKQWADICRKTGFGSVTIRRVSRYKVFGVITAKKLKNLAKNQLKTESEVLRHIIDAYLKDIDNRGLPYEPFRKLSFKGFKFLPRTIRKEQDLKLREIAERTGRKISKMVREAVERT